VLFVLARIAGSSRRPWRRRRPRTRLQEIQ
jgi:hypothetical protein